MYSSWEDLLRDVNLLVFNAMLYNPEDSPCYGFACELQALFNEAYLPVQVSSKHGYVCLLICAA